MKRSRAKEEITREKQFSIHELEAPNFEELIKTQENESKPSLELEFLKCTQSVVTKPDPSRDELETAVGLKTHTCLHLSMVHITVVTQSNWTHSESHTRTQHSSRTGRRVPDCS